MAELPTGTVTLLFTDIEGSTRLWEAHAAAMRAALARHDALLKHCIDDREREGARLARPEGPRSAGKRVPDLSSRSAAELSAAQVPGRARGQGNALDRGAAVRQHEP